MVKTITDETFYQGSEQKSGVIFSEIRGISFQMIDGVSVIYNEIGFIETVEDDILGTVDVKHILSTNILKYNDDEMKVLIENTGRDFNSPVTNMMIQEMNTFVDDIILNDITENPSNYFGLTVDKWTK